MRGKILVSRRLLFALHAHSIQLAKLKFEKQPSDAYYIVQNVLTDAAEAHLLLERAQGKRR